MGAVDASLLVPGWMAAVTLFDVPTPAGGCVNCGHDDHYGERCDGLADGDWCACSWPNPGNYILEPDNFLNRRMAKALSMMSLPERDDENVCVECGAPDIHCQCINATQPVLRIGHVTWRESKAFVGSEHRHHPPSRGHMWSTGVHDGDRLCGVAVIGRPVSRVLQEAGDIEVLRVCTDGTPNACSALYGAAARQAVAHGWKRSQLLTYILNTEPGTSLRAAGWLFDGLTDGGEWDRPSRSRKANAPTVPKQRWRAARP